MKRVLSGPYPTRLGTERKVTVKQDDIAHLSAMSCVITAHTVINRNMASFANKLIRLASRRFMSIPVNFLSSLITMATNSVDDNPAIEEQAEQEPVEPTLDAAESADSQQGVNDAKEDETDVTADGGAKSGDPPPQEDEVIDDNSLDEKSEDEDDESEDYESEDEDNDAAYDPSQDSSDIDDDDDLESNDDEVSVYGEDAVTDGHFLLPTQPSAEYLSLDSSVKLRPALIPYKPSVNGMRINYSNVDERYGSLHERQP